MKYIKWIFLVILIISLIITGILFVNFVQNRKILNDNPIIKELYNEYLYKKSESLFEDGELILESSVIDNPSSILFKEKNIICCSGEEMCNTFNYSINKDTKTLYIESNNKFLKQGIYTIAIEDNLVKLSTEEENWKYIYYFVRTNS